MSKRTKILIALGVIVLAAIGGGLWWFFKDDAPERFAIDDAVEDVADNPVVTSGEPVGDPAGSWTVAAGSEAGYRVDEELRSIGSSTAAGRTEDVSGSMTIEGGSVTAAEFVVDMTTLQSDESLRDGRLREQGLESNEFPEATFVLTEPIALPTTPEDGVAISVTAIGDLTLHGVTRTIELALDAQIEGSVLVVTANAPIVFADYEIDKPESPRVVDIADEGEFEVKLILQRA